ncbi:MAG: enoyl-CoA hydratase/isomerase family protein [Anaerolineales bacterium]|nr:enoyl-CoA hydratase/isomerase family protein [Anaerolineales bacterium]
MEHIQVSSSEGIATLVLQKGKVNALNAKMVEELRTSLNDHEEDPSVKAVVLTGRGKFFSFGFDIPSLLKFSQDAFEVFLTMFTDLYTYLYLYPKPVIAALNGHTIAGGCMIALACDYRLMTTGRAKISLNEITFGASVFAGSVEMLRACVGLRIAEKILLSGDMYVAEEALRFGLVDQIVPRDRLIEEAMIIAMNLANKDGVAFRSLKQLLRKPVLEVMREREKTSIQEFAEIWYSQNTWKNLEQIEIYE